MTTRRGFTLIEVMVAMAILSMGLTIILSSQTGLFAATQRVQNETVASSLMRCKMSEVELLLLNDGYPLIEQTDSGDCCEDEDIGSFRCEWRIQTVELPQPPTITENADGGDEKAAADAPTPSSLSDAQALLPTDGSALSGVTGIDDLAGTLGGSAEGGGMIGMALGLVYPTLKPLLEASIRKVTVAVIWNEGIKERRFEVVQYVTNPMEGNLNPNAAAGVDELLSKIPGATPPDSDSAAPPTSDSSEGAQ